MNTLKLSLIFLFAISLNVNAQTINQIDEFGNKEGKWIKKYENNNVKYEGQFHGNKPYGTFTYYYKDGKKKAMTKFRDNGVVADNETYYESGKLMAVGKYVNKKKDSIWNYYLDEEKNPIVSMETYKNGMLNGESITYYPNSGKPTEIIYFKNGKKNGKLLKYFPDGTLMTESYYKNGLPEGKFVHYHMDGKVQIEGEYSNGLQVGEWSYFDDEGNPIDEATFKKQDEVTEIEK